jgi:hypothetical protein
MTARQVFMLTALLPLLVSAAALLVDEKPVGPSGTSVQDVVSHLPLLRWRVTLCKAILFVHGRTV